MRNLKKTLCMVLALVFVLGLCTVGVGAANGTTFDDQDQINYTTAVKAMSGLGILKGDDNDDDGNYSFRPSDNVTRAEAAKIIAYVNVGEEVEKWPARQVFDDVPADHWAAKYVTYCQYNGIIAGYGNGKFGPNDPVTQAQLAKMLLSCCGYGAKGEFIGEGWDQNVAKVAFQTKVLKGILSTDWDGPANREETALLAYNTMMEVVQVVLSKDTNSYVIATINGDNGAGNGVTLADTTWDLTPLKCIVTNNKTNSIDAKGTTVEILNNDGTPSGTTYTFVTDEDENPDILGHQVNMMVRPEGVAPNVTWVAYYVDDSCTEATGAQVNTTEKADATCTIVNGVVTVGTGEPGSAKNYRSWDTGTYILNAEKKIVGYKTVSYWVYPLSFIPGTAIATCNNHEVVAPEGAKAGDMMTLYKNGDIWSVKPCTKEEKVAIEQNAKADNTTATPAAGCSYSYNSGAIKNSKAQNVHGLNLTSINAKAVYFTDKNFLPTTAVNPDLQVGWTYTLYFDAEGGLIGYADGVKTTEAASSNTYYLYVAAFGPVTDSYGTDQYYVQLVDASGKEVDLPVAKAYCTLDANNKATGFKDKNNVLLAKGDIVIAGTDSANAGKKILTKQVPPASVTEDTEGVVYGNYNPTNTPTVDFSSAKFILYSGEKGTLSAKSGDDRPKINTAIAYTFKAYKNGTVLLWKVDTVWFATKAEAIVSAKDSYVYVVSTDVVETKLVDNVAKPFYNGYKDGVKMDDLQTAAAPAVGFYTYDVVKGAYKLTPIPAGNGYDKVTVQNIYLVDKDTKNYIMGNTLYVTDSVYNVARAIDLTNVKFVRVAQTTDAKITTTLDSVAAIQALLLDVNTKYTVKLSFVEVPAPTAIDGVYSYSVGGGVIYITAVKTP